MSKRVDKYIKSKGIHEHFYDEDQKEMMQEYANEQLKEANEHKKELIGNLKRYLIGKSKGMGGDIYDGYFEALDNINEFLNQQDNE